MGLVKKSQSKKKSQQEKGKERDVFWADEGVAPEERLRGEKGGCAEGGGFGISQRLASA